MLSYKGGNLRINNIAGILADDRFIFSENTTYGLGGRAEKAYYPQTLNQCRQLINFLNSASAKYVCLGNGSNVLVADSGFDGAVISTKKLDGISFSDNGNIVCQSGVSVGKLLKFCKNNGVGGLEYLAGIPATIGGLSYMNGGAANRYVCENIDKVHFFNGENLVFSNKECCFSQKHSIMRDIKGLILATEFKVRPKSPTDIERDINYYLSLRAWHPKGRSCGCVFKNPAGRSAGKIIDEAGLKGARVGGAIVSDSHANFIINEGGTAADVYKLILKIKREVFEKKKVELSEELVYIGEFK